MTYKNIYGYNFFLANLEYDIMDVHLGLFLIFNYLKYHKCQYDILASLLPLPLQCLAVEYFLLKCPLFTQVCWSFLFPPLLYKIWTHFGIFLMFVLPL